LVVAKGLVYFGEKMAFGHTYMKTRDSNESDGTDLKYRVSMSCSKSESKAAIRPAICSCRR